MIANLLGWRPLATIRSRMWLVFAITFGALLLVTIWSVLVMHRTEDTVASFMDQDMPRVEHVRELQHLVKNIAFSAQNLASVTSIPTLSSAYNQVDELLRQLEKTTHLLSSGGVDPGVVEIQFMVQKIRSEAQLAFQLLDGALAPSSLAKVQRQAALTATGADLLNVLRLTVEDLVAMTQRYGEGILQGVDRDQANLVAVQRWATLSIISINLLVLIMISLIYWKIVALGFSRRLAIIGQSLIHVPTNTAETRLPISGDDEIAIMARRLESLLEKALTIQTMATTDELTGVANRRHFFQRCQPELERARRSGLEAVLLMMDVDFFKKVNDNFGHDVGDQALRLMAHACQRCLRINDILARLGGEEFVIYCPDTSLADGAQLAERIRSTIETLELDIPGSQQPLLTVSLGVSRLQPPNMALEQAMKQADQAMYQAKATGRNRVVIADEQIATGD